MGKSYDMESGTGLMLWSAVTERFSGAVARLRGPQPSSSAGVGRLGGRRFPVLQLFPPLKARDSENPF